MSSSSVSITSQIALTVSAQGHHGALLGPLDQPVTHFIPIAVALVFPPSSSNDEPVISAHKLRNALKLVLERYPIFSGRLSRQADASYQISNLDVGASFITAQSTSRLSDFASHADLTLAHFPEGGIGLFAPFDMSNAENQPILSIQHTSFACGGVSLGVRILHKVCDAIGVFTFLEDLARVYSDPTKIEEVASIAGPYYAPKTTSDSPPQSKFYTTEPYPTSSPPKGPTPPVTGRFIHLRVARLSTLKLKAQDENHSDPISTFDALSALILQAVHRARTRLRERDLTLSPVDPPCYLTSVNVRPLLGLSNRYINNCLLTPFFDIPSDTLLHAPLSQIARTFHIAVRAVTLEDVEDSARYIEEQDDKSSLRFKFRGGSGSVMTSQWSRLNMYPAFDGVRPILASTPFTEISLVDGLGYFLPNKHQGTEEDRGDIELCLALSDPLWQVLQEDKQWMDLVRP